jgi:hypothetical protein
LALARLLDSPRANSSQPAAAKVLAALLGKVALGVRGWWSRQFGGRMDDN